MNAYIYVWIAITNFNLTEIKVKSNKSTGLGLMKKKCIVLKQEREKFIQDSVKKNKVCVSPL